MICLYCGFVDYGIDVDDDSLPEASDTLVFMVVSLNSNWKVPCGYFLVNGLAEKEKANLNIVKLNCKFCRLLPVFINFILIASLFSINNVYFY